jgi:two-component system chemotaxis sensor kinase CheA
MIDDRAAARYAELFLLESREHLASADQALLSLERGGDVAAPVRELFRAVHTIKGMAGAMGYDAVAELSHDMEAVLERLRDGALVPDGGVLQLLFAAADALDDAVAAANAGGGTLDHGAVLERLRALAGAVEGEGSSPGAVPTVSAGATPTGGPGLRVLVRQSATTQLAGARALLVLRKLAALGRVLAVEPSEAVLASATRGGSFTVHLETDASAADVERAVRAAGDVDDVRLEAPGIAAAPAAGVVPTVDAAPAQAAPAAAASAEAGPAAAAPDMLPARAAATRSVRVDARRLDALLDVAGELVIARERLAAAAGAHADPALEDAVLRLTRLVGELQHEVLSTRLVPVAQLFDRFPRLIRDTARTLGKEVELAMEGRELELDRASLDELADPLVHLIRNALDHGLEAPAERLARGKGRTGRVTLSAAREGDAALVRVRDDGRGIDRAKVRARAVELGLAASGAELSDADVERLVSRAGFSTRARASAVSGRGVGVDAVQARLQAIGGAVEIESREGEGTTVTLRLPLTLAIIRALLARVGDEVYALPVSQVAATMRLEALIAADTPDGTTAGDGWVAALPRRCLRQLVGLDAAAAGERDVAVVECDGGRVALVVDELLDEQDVVVKRFDAARGALPGFSGATILGNGRPALIVDVGRLLN